MILKVSDLANIRKKFKTSKIIFAGGAFDILHRGHIKFLKNLRKYGDLVVIAISTDKRIKERKGDSRPIMSQNDRAFMIDSIKYVDFVVIAPEPAKQEGTPTRKIMKLLKPDSFITIDKRWLEYEQEIKNDGIQLHVLDGFEGRKINSTTNIIKKILKKHTP